jgi:organic radical activating enzyme
MTGGEPCLHPGIVELAAHAREIGLAIHGRSAHKKEKGRGNPALRVQQEVLV